ncbi:HD domain-containing protein [Niveibacterium microcysteis]|uniref:Bifunctional (P)ppGpp synthetase/guanosine-3',5'-bis(Diphosphate) 3'-pyrophosphohydrolase n=1 Tax=Niveibacterium microcysteis TaxID=2811415 RepID=A0ABX7MAA3_9RHOO|nr:HD domain-containing protein [Niveibacterium microcysteis]QSI78675.1 bifunctional (p)ppGpp synthetase/guanosine-3',5'-bis(diphosphate) 3'-pyrophosphohydrolase [Niveibacterium microcysteis]
MTISAREFAIAAHGDQRYGERPYVFHLDRVVENLSEFGPLAETVGYLHDVVEDTAVTVAEIAEKFGPLVAECVALLTDEPGSNRKERKAKTYKKLATVRGVAELALIVKVADRLANVRACINDGRVALWAVYRDEHPTFRAAAYRPGQCNRLWRQLDDLLLEGACGVRV